MPLNADYEGRSLFFIPVNSKLGELAESDVNVRIPILWHAAQLCSAGEEIPQRGESEQRMQLIELLLPAFTGDRRTRDGAYVVGQVGIGTIYNKTIWHGVTRMSSGTRCVYPMRVCG